MTELRSIHTALAALAAIVVLSSGCAARPLSTAPPETSETAETSGAPETAAVVLEDCREGPVRYITARAWGEDVLVRAEPSERQRRSSPAATDAFFPDLDRESRNIDVLVTRITGGDGTPCRTDDEIWSRFRRLWAWGPDHIRQDTEAVAAMTGDGWPSILELTLAERRLGYVPVGTCFSTAHAYATLMARIGIPRDRFAIATALYGDTASHVYLAIFVGGEWCYFDPSFVRTCPPLPADLGQIASWGSPDLGVDYAHPISMKYTGPGPRERRLPRLSSAPGYAWRTATASAEGVGR